MTKVFNIRQVVKIIGALLLIEGFFMLVTAGVSYYYHEDDLNALLYSAAITGSVGLIGVGTARGSKRQLGTREGYLIVGTVWIFFSLFGMLPFLISGYIPSVADAFFETMSGFTTTGASILTNIDSMPHGLLFWRALSHWLGGLGIVVMSMAILPLFGAGMQVYQAETSGLQHDKLLPRIKDTARRLWELYVTLTLAQTLLLWAAGMGLFDAVCHAFSTMATGGFSTKQASLAYWSQPAIHYITIVFMFIAGINFSLLYNTIIKRHIKRLFSDDEFKTYAIVVGVVTLGVMASLLFYETDFSLASLEYDFRRALFQVVSVITSTGFATDDYIQWSPTGVFLILFLMFVGASAGSTAGGLKMIRFNIIVKNAYFEFRRAIHPKAVIPVRVNHHVIPDHIISSVLAFLTVYVMLIVVGTVVLLLCQMSLSEAFGAALSMISNVGPGLGAQGPMGSFAMIPDFAKWFLSILMLIGRLEMFTILLLFSPLFWKK